MFAKVYLQVSGYHAASPVDQVGILWLTQICRTFGKLDVLPSGTPERLALLGHQKFTPAFRAASQVQKITRAQRTRDLMSYQQGRLRGGKLRIDHLAEYVGWHFMKARQAAPYFLSRRPGDLLVSCCCRRFGSSLPLFRTFFSV